MFGFLLKCCIYLYRDVNKSKLFQVLIPLLKSLCCQPVFCKSSMCVCVEDQ